VVIDPPTACECCGGNRLRKLGEDVTRTLESVPRQWKVVETVREKFSCRDCEKISQAPAPFHVISRGWAGSSLLAMIMFEKFGQHQPLNRQAERYALEGVPIALSTMADAVGSVCAALDALLRLVEAHVMADSAPRPCIASLSRPRSMASTRKPGWLSCPLASPFIPPIGWMSCYPGIGRPRRQRSRPGQRDNPRQQGPSRHDHHPRCRTAWRRRGLAARRRQRNGNRGRVIWVYGVEDGVLTFTDFGIESLIELIRIHKENPELLKRCDPK
jgi:transposase